MKFIAVLLLTMFAHLTNATPTGGFQELQARGELDINNINAGNQVAEYCDPNDSGSDGKCNTDCQNHGHQGGHCNHNTKNCSCHNADGSESDI